LSEEQNISFDDFIKNKLANHVSPVSAALWDKVNANIDGDAAMDNFVKTSLANFSSPVSASLWDKINTKIGSDASLDDFIKTSIEDYASPVADNLGDRIIGDEIIKDKLNNYSSKVPDGLWEKIFADKERRPKFFWWFNADVRKYAVAAVLLLLLGYTFYAANKKSAMPVNATVQHETNSSIKNTPNNSVNPIDNANNNQTIDHNNTINTPSSEINQSSNNFNNNLSSNKKTSVRIDQLNNTKVSFIKTQSLPFTENFNNEVAENGNKYQFNTANNSSVTANNFIPGKLIPFGVNLKDHTNPFPPINLRNLLGIGMSDCPSANGNRRNDWYIEVYASPDYTMKSITANSASSAYLQKVDSSQTMNGGFTAGVRIAKNIGEDFMFKTGIQYSQVNELFNRKTVNEVRTTIVINSRTIVRPQGDTTISDTTSLTQIGYSIKKAVNQYRNIEIPLTLGYEFAKKDSKWKLGLNGGVIVNIASWASGETLDTAYNVVPISTSKGSSSGVVYKTKAGISLYASASVIREINKGVELFAEPYFRYGLSNTTTDAGYSQRFNALGLSVGMRLKLNNKRQHL
jgi:hypothetical protein